MSSLYFLAHIIALCGIAVASFTTLLVIAGLIVYLVPAWRSAEVAGAAAVREWMFWEEKRLLASRSDQDDTTQRQSDGLEDAEEGLRLSPYRDEEYGDRGGRVN